MDKRKILKSLSVGAMSLLMAFSSISPAFAITGDGNSNLPGGPGEQATPYIVKVRNPVYNKKFSSSIPVSLKGFHDMIATINGLQGPTRHLYNDWNYCGENRCKGSEYAYVSIDKHWRGFYEPFYQNTLPWKDTYFIVDGRIRPGRKLYQIDKDADSIESFMRRYRGPFAKKPVRDQWNYNSWGDTAVYYVCSNQMEQHKTVSRNVIVYERLVVTPVTPKGFNKLPADQKKYWNETHHKQNSGGSQGYEITKYGQAIKNFKRNGNKTQLLNVLRENGGKTIRTPGRRTVTLDAKNKEGLARGGAFTITQDIKTVTVHEDWVKKPGKSWEVEKIRISNPSSWATVYSWQILNARCNDASVRALANRTGSKVVASNDINTQISSPLKEWKGVQHSYDNVPMSMFTSTKCNIPCQSKPINSYVSDVVNNVQDKGLSADNGKYGGQIDGKSSDTFQIFRDNLRKGIRLDVWYPVMDGTTESGSLSISAKKTLFSFDPNGSPDTKEFEVLTDSGREVIPKGEFKHNLYRALDGEVNKTTWKADWASSSPHRVNVNYAYEPKPNTPIYNTLVGYKSGSTVRDYRTILNVYCPAVMNTKTSVKGIISNDPKPDTYEKEIKFNSGENLYATVKFVKSSAENGTSE